MERVDKDIELLEALRDTIWKNLSYDIDLREMSKEEFMMK